MSLEAEAATITLREDAERYAVASRAADEARDEAARRLADAEERIQVIEIEARDRARAAAEVARRARLQEANDEIHLALLALGALGDPVDLDDALRVAVGATSTDHQNGRADS